MDSWLFPLNQTLEKPPKWQGGNWLSVPKYDGRNGWEDDMTEPKHETEQGLGQRKPCPMTWGMIGSSCLKGPCILLPTLPWEWKRVTQIGTWTWPKPVVFQLRSHVWFQDLMKLRFLMYHCRKKPARVKVIVKKWVSLETGTLHVQSMGHLRRQEQPWNTAWVVFMAEKAIAPQSSTLAWKIPRTEEPGRLQSMGLLRVRHDWATSLSLFTFMHWRRKWQPTPVFLPGESQGWGSLVGCSLWGCTESDTTEAT